MSAQSIAASGFAGEVVESRCIGCGTCVAACAYGAVRLRETPDGSKATVQPSLCRGDGLCSSLCATGAIVLRDPSDQEIFRQIDVALGQA